MKRYIRKIIPNFVLLTYHFLFNLFALILYRNPSKKIIIIGVTGTKGKTTTSLLIYKALTAAGEKVGLLSTAQICIGEISYENDMHMTLKGRGFVHKQLRRMVNVGCRYAVIETPSEALTQFRVFGVHYDSLVFTNLSSEHLVTHGTFDKYMKAKGCLFKMQTNSSQKIIDGNVIGRYIILNGDDENFEYFNNLSISPINKIIIFGKNSGHKILFEGNSFVFDGERYNLPLPGLFMAFNMVPAILLVKKYSSINTNELNNAFSDLYIPGRLERIDEGQKFHVFCDYAHEPLSIKSVYEALKVYRGENGKVIMVVGGVGDSRWKFNGYEIGKISSHLADVLVVTDVDPFFDDSEEIIDSVVSGIEENSVYYKELDRRLGIRKALHLAKTGDVVIITGKGSEVTISVGGKNILFDERGVIREELNKLN